MSVSEALSRPKPPEAGAEGQPLRGFAHRRPSPGEIEGPRGCPSPAPFFEAYGGPSKRGAASPPRRPAVSCASIWTGPRSTRGRTPSIAAAAAFDVSAPSERAEDRASGAFSFERG